MWFLHIKTFITSTTSDTPFKKRYIKTIGVSTKFCDQIREQSEQ